MTATENLNLILSFKLVGDRNSHVCGAARIKVDGRGALTIYDAGSGYVEKIALADLQSLSIQSLGCASQAA